MTIVNIHEAKTHLSRLVERAAAGEEIVIAKAGRPVARLVAVQPLAAPRPLGLLAGEVTETADWWAPDAELESLFGGSAIEPGPQPDGAAAAE